MDKPNMKKLSCGSYLVRTQAGFKRALKDYLKDSCHEYYGGHPESYPSVVDFYEGYTGYHYVRASCVHVNKRKEQLEMMIAEIRDE